MASHDLRQSGYVSRLEELWYGVTSPLYDLLTAWCFLPMGGEGRCRDWIADCVAPAPGHEVLCLCCGTGTTDRVLLRRASGINVTGLDLGAGQVATARRKDQTGAIRYLVGDASKTGLHGASYDRVLIGLALHEMPRELRLAVVREAGRLCKPDGRVIAVEHATMARGASKLLRDLWWLTWLPGNPERATTRDLQRHGLEKEMAEAGVRMVGHYVRPPGWIEAVVGRPG